mmetsp:Transcript_40838/g.61688  ORF Transcript_40838/g.61688 Transcript_40838/m.61688 type:complete len:84 (-) Transcript_40838:251-502(-)|eukprot:CAMPEP_0194752270 /NCGR_PEP_ID=MMETSP0323_2-20130528/6060_1 /TAXON_ID=2866 ORGANISM="Crypthecodinium cohnii, Strain Seligo" /NCGR_SAMPLE_ID=MMETSP0323_2 /ASSEMBLY_ACC=CAM_ASM_000346 /LENGTH=83 /DNA_ID=CAMNT_0039669057 /DNA_START=39 /DNA_END=290 /DNA_ORIENTATION=+
MSNKPWVGCAAKTLNRTRQDQQINHESWSLLTSEQAEAEAKAVAEAEVETEPATDIEVGEFAPEISVYKAPCLLDQTNVVRAL